MVSDRTNANTGGSSSGGVSTGSRRQDPLIGTVIAERYLILEVLGRGGMGVVYKARHEMMERTVAIKMLLPQLVADEGAAARFRREAMASSKLKHSNIISLHDYGRTEDGTPYLVMDYIEGESLSDVLKRENQLGTMRSAHIFQQVCDALAHAHEQGIIHRDLKPGNIMLMQTEEERDFVKVVDFGIAKIYESDDSHDGQKLTSTGELFGSPVYMSPEQCGGYELDVRSDIYSLGCVMYETLTGKLPCVGKTVLETISKQLTRPAANFSEARADLYIPEWMERVVMKALEKEPAKRQQTMQEVRQEIITGQFNSSLSQTSLRAISGNSTITGVNSRRRAASAQASSAEWKKYALYTVAVVALLGGAMLAISLMPKPVPKENPMARPESERGHQHRVGTEADHTAETDSSPKAHTEKPPAHQSPAEHGAAQHRPAQNIPAEHVGTPHTPSEYAGAQHPGAQHRAAAEKPIVHHATQVTERPNRASTKSTGDADSVAPAHYKAHRKHGEDFYDYAGDHEGQTGDPTPLPVKEWSPN